MATGMAEGKRTGLLPFLAQLDRLRATLRTAAENSAPGAALLAAGGRTPLFMLEALCRIHRVIGTEETFQSLYTSFKELEDALGAVDYYAAIQVQVRTAGLRELEEHFGPKHAAACARVEQLLWSRGWLEKADGGAQVGPRIQQITGILTAAKWQKPKKYRRNLIRFLRRVARKIADEIRKDRIDFNDIEHGLHEFRRNIRWISIYAHALGGIIQVEGDPQHSGLERYRTASVLNSPLSKLPPFQGTGEPIRIHSDHWFALSWLIEALGSLKDRAQLAEEVARAQGEIGRADATRGVLEALGCVDSLEEISREGAAIVRRFVLEDRVLRGLRRDLKANV